MRSTCFVSALCLLACGAPPPPTAPRVPVTATGAETATAPHGEPGAAAPQPASCPRASALDAAAVRDEVVCLLQRYVRIDTTNPPGNELAAARFLQQVLQREGIDARVLESAPGRANLYARIEGGEGKPIVLMHHMDVVPASAEEWSVPPLSGELRDGELWGCGAIDNKGAGVVQLLATIMLLREQRALPRDVILLAVADEEAGGGVGARWLMEHHFDLFADVGAVLNEGGGILQLGEGHTVYSVELAQKAPLWLRITARGPSGHGSAPRPDAATHVLARALARLEAHRFPVRVTPEVQAVFTARAQGMPAAERAAFLDLQRSLDRPAFRKKFLSDPRQAALVQNTLSITMLSASDKENVLPPSASAVLDLRLLPGEDAAEVTAGLIEVMAEPAIEVETLLSWQAHTSPRDTPTFEAIARFARARDPGAPVTANVIAGFTDCNAFRARGITCYGFMPMRLAPPMFSRIHGKDERIPIDTLTTAVLDLATLLQQP